MPLRRWGRLGLTLLAVAGFVGTASGAATRIFRQTTAKDFEEGEATGSQILPGGELVAGLASVRVPHDVGFVWTSAAGQKGDTIYFGTGDPGRIIAVPARSGWGKDGPARVVAEKELDTP